MAPKAEQNGVVRTTGKDAVVKSIDVTVAKEQPTKVIAVVDAVFALLVFAIALIVLPIIVPLALFLRAYHYASVTLATLKKHIRFVRVTPDDSLWLQESNENRAIINAFVRMKGKADVEMWREIFAKRMVEARRSDSPQSEKMYPKITMFNKILQRYVWVEEEHFNIDEHIFYCKEEAGDEKEDVEKLISDICTTPLPENKSPWQFILLKTRNPDSDSYYVISRFHHAIGDGVSLVGMLMNSVVDEELTEAPAAPRVPSPGKTKRLLLNIFHAPAFFLKRLAWPADCSILHGPSLSGRKVVSWSEAVDLKLIKKIKNIAGTTVNDVLVSCIAGAFREYYLKFENSIPKYVSSYIPVDIRTSRTKLSLDNQFSLVFLHLPTDCDSCVDTLAKTKARMDQIKTSPEPLVNAIVLRSCVACFPNWLSTRIINWLSRKCTLVLSNVPGPKTKLTIGGEPVEDILFWPPQKANVGLGLSIFSYADTVRIGVIADRNLLTNPGLLVQEFVSKVHQLAGELKAD